VSDQVKSGRKNLESKCYFFTVRNLHLCNFEQTIRASLSETQEEPRTIAPAWRALLYQSHNPTGAGTTIKGAKSIIFRAFWLQLI
jgi:hypothetical protein